MCLICWRSWIPRYHAAIGTRIFLFPKLINCTDNTEDSTINTTDYGTKIFIVEDGFYDWTFRYQKGGVQATPGIGKECSVLIITSFSSIRTMFCSGTTLADIQRGFPIEQYPILPWRLNTGSEAALYNQRVHNRPYLFEQGNLGFLKVTSTWSTWWASRTWVMAIIDQAANVSTVKVRSKISDVDLYGTYRTSLLTNNCMAGIQVNGRFGARHDYWRCW